MSVSCWSSEAGLNINKFQSSTFYVFIDLITCIIVKPSTICPFSHLGCHLQKRSQNIPFRLGLPPIDTGVPNGLLMLRNSLKDFAFEHRSGCCATEPGYARDIGTIEI